MNANDSVCASSFSVWTHLLLNISPGTEERECGLIISLFQNG
jgi:hypothetical protein